MKDTRRANASWSKAPTRVDNMSIFEYIHYENIYIWVVDLSNQLFIRSCYTETKLSKQNKAVTAKPSFVHFCTPQFICHNPIQF